MKACAAVLAAVALVSCSAPPKGTDAGTGGVDGGVDAGLPALSLDDFLAQGPTASCAAAKACGWVSSVEGCLQMYALSDEACDSAYFPCETQAMTRADVRAAVAHGRMAYSPDEAALCVAQLRDQPTCGTQPAACLATLTALVADGQACYRPTECAGAHSYCSSAATCPGVCAPKKQAGEDAGTPDECLPTLTVYNGRCMAPVAQGASCAPVSPATYPPPCADGSYCDASSQCVAKLLAGAACSLTELCIDALQCVNGTCQAPPPPLDIGAVCDTGSCSTPGCMPGTRRCMADLRCETAHSQDTTGICAPRGGADGGCFFTTNDCQPGFHCVGAVFAPADGGWEGACQPKVGLSGPCTSYSFDCQAGLVCSVYGVCVTPTPDGAFCSNPGECVLEDVCTAQRCVAAFCRDTAP